MFTVCISCFCIYNILGINFTVLKIFIFFVSITYNLHPIYFPLAALDIFREKGSDSWWELSVADLLPPKYKDQAEEYTKGTDTMDVWFDSGE